MKSFVVILLTLLFFNACETSLFSPSKEEISLKKEEIKAKEKKAILELNIQKEIAIASINSEINKEKILSTQRIQSQDIQLQKYYLIFTAFVIVIISFFIFLYFNNKRKDKLRAYEDNLKKYFHEKENQTKIKLTQELLKTLQSNNLSKEQKNILISNVNINDDLKQNNEDEEELIEFQNNSSLKD